MNQAGRAIGCALLLAASGCGAGETGGDDVGSGGDAAVTEAAATDDGHAPGDADGDGGGDGGGDGDTPLWTELPGTAVSVDGGWAELRGSRGRDGGAIQMASAGGLALDPALTVGAGPAMPVPAAGGSQVGAA